jgi:hypothetical protein
MTLLKRKRVLAAKIEATPGTAETLTTADATFNVYEPMIQMEIEKTEREGQGSFGYLPSIAGARRGRCTFKTDFSWDGTATEPAWADTFFPACGLVKATNTYTPRSEVPGTNVKTLTIGLYQDGVRKILRGCVGTFKLVCETGKPVMIEWDFIGVWDAPTDVTILAPTYTTDPVLRYASGVTTFNSVALQCASLTLDIANEMILREGTAASNPTGFIAGAITNRKPIVTCNPESKLVATQNRHGIFLDATEYALVWEIGGSSAPKVVITAPKATIQTMQEADRNRLQVDDLTFLCCQNGSTADQEFSIVFTP